jgi:HlyD family secretion protein
MHRAAFEAQLLPASVGSELLAGYLARHRTGGGPIYGALLLLVAGGVVALPLTRVEVSVQAPGVVRPAADKHDLRAPRAGAVAALLARENERVERGAAVLVLHDAAWDARVATVAAQLAAARDETHDLRALTADPTAGATLRTARYREERLRLAAAEREVALRQAAAGERAGRTAALLARGLATPVEAAEDHAAVARADAELVALRRREAAAWHAALASSRAALGALALDSAALAAEGAALVVRAPVAGTLEQVAQLAPGSFVQGGDVVAVVSPDQHVVAEVYVPPRDVGGLRVGGPVRLQVDAFDYTVWGTAEGRVAAIGDDYLRVDGRPVFKVRCTLVRPELVGPDGARARVRKGMTVRARFPVARRSLLAWLRGALHERLDPRQPRRVADAG